MPNLSAPKNVTWWIAVLAGLLGLLLYFFGSPAIGFWLLVLGFALLAVATLIEGL